MKYRKLEKYKYQLVEDITIQTSVRPKYNIFTTYCSLMTNGLLTIYAGYASDGASGPTRDDKTNMTAAMGHDCLYQLIRGGFLSPKYRLEADITLRDI